MKNKAQPELELEVPVLEGRHHHARDTTHPDIPKPTAELLNACSRISGGGGCGVELLVLWQRDAYS